MKHSFDSGTSKWCYSFCTGEPVEHHGNTVITARPDFYKTNEHRLIWTAASTTGVLATAFTDTGTILVAVVGVIVAALVALLGLGFGIRHLRKYITGRKF